MKTHQQISKQTMFTYQSRHAMYNSAIMVQLGLYY